jgi:cell division protein FtsI (penicillin-binding protein 3)
MKTFISPRITILSCLLFSGFAVLEWRLIHLQILRHEELEEKAEDYRFTTRAEQSWRGQIQDRNGIQLALTVPVKDVYADLEVWTNRVESLARIVAPLLGMDQVGLTQRVRQSLNAHNDSPADRGPGVLLLKRGITPTEWAPIKDALACETFGLQTNKLSSRQRTLLKGLRRWTLFAEDDQRRFYPYGKSLAQVLGFSGTGTDGHLLQGKWGLEASLDNLLAGQNGVCVSSQDAAGNELAFCRTTNVTVRDGAHVVLTIDLTLQKIVEDALAEVVARYNPSNASCVVVRPSTGEILAMASLPAFSPQQPGSSPPATWRNHVISDRNEVGSVFKVITLAAALELGAVNLDQRINCENGTWLYKKSALHDDGHRNGLLTVRECLAKSSNIGLAKIALLVGTDGLYGFITKFGFDRATGVPLPYETPGFIRNPTNWSATSITRVAIGQEFAVSQLQLAMAYAAIANDGKLMQPMLVRQLDHADGTLWGRYQPKVVRSVVRPETARQLREAMQAVVEHGTGKAAALPDYTVAGKTGTAQKSDGHRYVPGRLYCSFVGMVPAGKPELVIAVAVDEPKDSAYGGVVAAPVFREIAEQAVILYHIAPDKEIGSSRQTFVSSNPNFNRDLIAMRP